MMALPQEIYPELSWVENADVEVADLLEKVAAGEIDFTIADSTEFNIQRHFYPDLRVALDLEIGDPLAWAFPSDTGDHTAGPRRRFYNQCGQNRHAGTSQRPLLRAYRQV